MLIETNRIQYNNICEALERGGNGFYTSAVNQIWNDLVTEGYATKKEGDWISKGMAFYTVTEKGKIAVNY